MQGIPTEKLTGLLVDLVQRMHLLVVMLEGWTVNIFGTEKIRNTWKQHAPISSHNPIFLALISDQQPYKYTKKERNETIYKGRAWNKQVRNTSKN